MPGATDVLERLGRRLELQPEEAKRALSLGLILAGVTGSYTLTKTVRDAFYLATLPATTLPYIYIAVGIVTAVASVLFARATRRRSSWEGLAGMAMVAAISLAVFGQLFRLKLAWIPIAFYLWVNVYGLILVSQFWLFANSVSHPREARRTFGLIGSGGILGALVGGAIASPLAHLWTLSSLLNVAALLQALVVLLMRVGPGRAGETESVEAAPARVMDAARHPYVRWLALAAVCSVIVTGVLDYLFKVEIQRRYPSSAELASFLGLFYMVTSLAALVLQTLGTRWMLQRLGAAWSVALLPAGLGIGVGFVFAFPGFAAVAASRLWDQVTRLSVNKSVGELFYFPLEPGLRRKAKALIEAGLERLGDGFAGLLILAAGAAMGASTRVLAAAVVVLLGVWIVAWLGVRRGYVTELGQNLRRLNLGGSQSRVSLREATLLHEMERLLASRYDRIVIHGVDLLEENFPEEIEAALSGLLEHSSARVRVRALGLVRARRLEAHQPRVEDLIQDPDGEVQIEALSTLCALRGTDPFDSVREYLDSADPRVRKAAILCVTEHAPCESEGRVRETLERMLREGQSADRVTVAEALGRRPAPCELHDLLGPLLGDADVAVRRVALRSAGRGQRRAHIPILVDALGSRATEEAARAGLVFLGDRVVGTLGDYQCDPSVPIEVRHAIPRALGEIRGQESVNALFRWRGGEDARLSYRILKAANRIRSADASVQFPVEAVTEDIERDVRGHLLALVHYRSCPIGRGQRSAERFLCVVLNERMEHALERVFRRLALLYPPQNVVAAYRGVTSDRPRLRGNAIEYLENALLPGHRRMVLPLVDDTGDEGRLKLADQRYGLRSGSYDETLEALLQSEDAWLRACALYVAGSRKEARLLTLVESNLTTFDKLVRETAAWARLAIATG